jgi:hypothetical protein
MPLYAAHVRAVLSTRTARPPKMSRSTALWILLNNAVEPIPHVDDPRSVAGFHAPVSSFKIPELYCHRPRRLVHAAQKPASPQKVMSTFRRCEPSPRRSETDFNEIASVPVFSRLRRFESGSSCPAFTDSHDKAIKLERIKRCQNEQHERSFMKAR